MFISCIIFCVFNIYWGSALLVKVFVILCREVIKSVSVYCFHMQAHIMVLLCRMQKQLWNIAHQLVTQLPMWNSFVTGCFIPLWRLLMWITVKFLTYTIASTRVALTGCNVTPAQDGYTRSVKDWSDKLQCSAKSTHAFLQIMVSSALNCKALIYMCA